MAIFNRFWSIFGYSTSPKKKTLDFRLTFDFKYGFLAIYIIADERQE
jgi:hypothetical protein